MNQLQHAVGLVKASTVLMKDIMKIPLPAPKQKPAPKETPVAQASPDYKKVDKDYAHMGKVFGQKKMHDWRAKSKQSDKYLKNRREGDAAAGVKEMTKAIQFVGEPSPKKPEPGSRPAGEGDKKAEAMKKPSAGAWMDKAEETTGGWTNGSTKPVDKANVKDKSWKALEEEEEEKKPHNESKKEEEMEEVDKGRFNNGVEATSHIENPKSFKGRTPNKEAGRGMTQDPKQRPDANIDNQWDMPEKKPTKKVEKAEEEWMEKCDKTKMSKPPKRAGVFGKAISELNKSMELMSEVMDVIDKARPKGSISQGVKMQTKMENKPPHHHYRPPAGSGGWTSSQHIDEAEKQNPGSRKSLRDEFTSALKRD